MDNYVMGNSMSNRCDMISTLPDDILCHILSFLETKYAVRSSVLSKRWKNLFAFVPILHFEGGDIHEGETSNTHNKFIRFVNRVLLLYKINEMRSFIVNYCFPNALNSHIHSWVSAAIIRNVRELCLFINSDEIVQLPRDLCNSNTLVELDLDGNFGLNLGNSMCWPSLKKLYLNHMHIRMEEGSKRMSFSIFPVLEQLVLCCDFDPDVRIEISIPSLKKLQLWVLHEQISDILINTPALEGLLFFGEGLANISGNVFASLIKANFYFYPPFENANGFRNLIKMASNVHNLYLSENSMEALLDYELPRYQNLTCLELVTESKGSNGWKLLPVLLERSPNLQVLIVKKRCIHLQEDVGMEHLLAIRDCAYSPLHLKELEFRNFTGFEHEFRLVEYILNIAKVLNKVIICLNKPLNSRHVITQRLIALPRCSRDCQFMVFDKYSSSSTYW